VTARETPEPLTPEEAVEKALLYTFQLSDKDYRKMQRASSETAFIRALEQDGYTIAALRAATPDPDPAERPERFDRTWSHYADDCPTPPGYTPDPAEPGLTCAKCHATDISTRWDRNHFDCLYREQERGDWPRDGGEHLHHTCRTCGYSWAAALAENQP
jgi:hypothetical protein